MVSARTSDPPYERTQELLLDFAQLMSEGQLAHTSVFIDSPLASRATQVFRRYTPQLEDIGDNEVFQHPRFTLLRPSKRQNASRRCPVR